MLVGNIRICILPIYGMKFWGVNKLKWGVSKLKRGAKMGSV